MVASSLAACIAGKTHSLYIGSYLLVYHMTNSNCCQAIKWGHKETNALQKRSSQSQSPRTPTSFQKPDYFLETRLFIHFFTASLKSPENYKSSSSIQAGFIIPLSLSQVPTFSWAGFAFVDEFCFWFSNSSWFTEFVLVDLFLILGFSFCMLG
ncbi:hypothetical protein SLA2020_506420 [Shorea laevis]